MLTGQSVFTRPSESFSPQVADQLRSLSDHPLHWAKNEEQASTSATAVTEALPPLSPLNDDDLTSPSLATTPALREAPNSGDAEPWNGARKLFQPARLSYNVPQRSILSPELRVDVSDFLFSGAANTVEGTESKRGAAGKGRTAIVQFARRRSDDLPVAIKFLKHGIPDEVNQELLMLGLQSQIAMGDAIARSLGYFKDPESSSIAIVMERMDGSLDKFRGRPLAEEAAVAALAMTLVGLSTLHDQLQVIHRDIKPANLLYHRASGVVKIADFGMSTCLGNNGSTSQVFVGTVMYMAPERLRGERYGPLSDVWSAGLVAVELMLGYHPYPPAFPPVESDREHTPETTFWAIAEVLQHAEGDDEKTERAIERLVFTPLVERGITTKVVEVLRRMLCSVSKRVTAAEALRLLATDSPISQHRRNFQAALM